jgi:hypothetical protein
MDKSSALKLLMNTLYYDLMEEDKDTGIQRYSKLINGEEVIISFLDNEGICDFCDWEVRIEYPDNDLRVRTHMELRYVRYLIHDIESNFPNKVN